MKTPRREAPRRDVARRSPSAARGPAIDRILEKQAWESLVPLVRAAGADPDRAIPMLRLYARALVAWNRSVSNLISRNDEARILERHIRESIEPAAWLKEAGHERWLDFGSGAGLPAIPLGILGVGAAWTLVEARRPKILFMRKTIADIGLRHFEVIHGRLEQAGDLGRFQGFTARAVMKVDETLALAAPVVDPGGSAFLWKGAALGEELRTRSSWEKDWREDGVMPIGLGVSVVARFVRQN